MATVNLGDILLAASLLLLGLVHLSQRRRRRELVVYVDGRRVAAGHVGIDGGAVGVRVRPTPGAAWVQLFVETRPSSRSGDWSFSPEPTVGVSEVVVYDSNGGRR